MQRDPEGGIHFQQVSVPEAVQEAVEKARLRGSRLAEATSVSATLTPLTRQWLSKPVGKHVHREIVRLGRELAQELQDYYYEPDRPLHTTQIFLQWLPQVQAYFHGLGLDVREGHITHDHLAQGQRFRSFFNPMMRGGAPTLAINGNLTIGEYLGYRAENFRTFLLDYIAVIKQLLAPPPPPPPAEPPPEEPAGPDATAGDAEVDGEGDEAEEDLYPV
jgi:hypothetical protein